MKEKATRPSLKAPSSLVAPAINSDDPLVQFANKETSPIKVISNSPSLPKNSIPEDIPTRFEGNVNVGDLFDMQIKGIDHDLQKYDFIDHDGIIEESFPTRESTLMALVEVDQEPTVTLSISAQKTPPPLFPLIS